MPEIESRNIKTQFLHHRADGQMLTQLVALYEQGKLPLPQIEVLDLVDAREAHVRSESGRTKGKIVLKIADL